MRFNFVNGLHSLLNHLDLTGSLDNLDVNPDDPFGKYESPDGRLGRLGPVNSRMWYQNVTIEESNIMKPGQSIHLK
jgi:hypothetical protein